MLFMGPGIKHGSHFDFPGTQVDVAPTLLGLAGMDTPGYMDGRSLVPLLVSADVAEEQQEVLLQSVRHHLNNTFRKVEGADGRTLSQRDRTLERGATLHEYYNQGLWMDTKSDESKWPTRHLDDWSNTWLGVYYEKNGQRLKYG